MSMGDRIKVTKWNDTRRTRWKSRSEIVEDNTILEVREMQKKIDHRTKVEKRAIELLATI